MAIAVTCRCGQKFAAKDELAGKRVKCPKCGDPLVVPGTPAANDPSTIGSGPAAKKIPPRHEDAFDEIGLILRGEGQQDCPECGSAVPNNAVLCVNCGYNFQLGRRLPTLGTTNSVPVHRAEEVKPKTEIDRMLEFAENELEKEPLKQELGYGSRWSSYIIALVMVGVFAAFLAAGMAFFNYMEGEAATKAREKAASKLR